MRTIEPPDFAAFERAIGSLRIPLEQLADGFAAVARAIAKAFGAIILEPERVELVGRMVADGWPRAAAIKYALDVPLEVCWLYPVPVPPCE